MIGKAVYSILNGTAAVTTIVSDRIYPLRNSELATYPAITYLQIAKTPTDTIDAVSGLDRIDVDIDLFHTNYLSLLTLADAVRTALDQVSGTYGGLTISNCKFVSEFDGIDDAAGLCRITQQYRFIVIR